MIVKIVSGGQIILYEHSLGGVPVPQFNQFRNIDKPMLATVDISKLTEFWKDREKLVNTWDNDVWEVV
jgi:hypothetical protein